MALLIAGALIIAKSRTRPVSRTDIVLGRMLKRLEPPSLTEGHGFVAVMGG
jgi:hypothetical protein